MKITYLLMIFGFILSGCGSSDNSRPAQDGIGEIDIVEYLPSKTMTKYFSYGHFGGTIFGGEGYQNITIENNKINIEQHAHNLGRFYTGDVVQYMTITYNKDSVTNLLLNYMTELENKPLDRHVDIEELLGKDSKKEEREYSIYENGENLTIGTILTERTYECFYENIVNNIKDKYNESVRADGNFLVIQCNTSEKETYYIDKKYRDISDEHNKVDSFKAKYLYYYEKGIGLVFYTSVENDDISSGYTYNVTSIQ